MLLGAILFNVLPGMLSARRIYAVQSWTPPGYVQCAQFVPCTKVQNIVVLPDEKLTALVIGGIAAALAILTFLFPRPVSGHLQDLWNRRPRSQNPCNRKHLPWIAITCLVVGFVLIALGYPTMCCEKLNGFVPPQVSLYAELFLPSFAVFHMAYGYVLVFIGRLFVIIAIVVLGIDIFLFRRSLKNR